MERKPSFIIEPEKAKELIKRLKPITDWTKVDKGTKIFHKDDNNIFNNNEFLSYNEKSNIIKYMVIDYTQRENPEYTMSASNWYYYDESIADNIEEEFRPKLWWSHKVGYSEDFWICVAKDVTELRQRYEEERKETITQEEFEENYEYSIIDRIDEYNIELK